MRRTRRELRCHQMTDAPWWDDERRRQRHRPPDPTSSTWPGRFWLLFCGTDSNSVTLLYSEVAIDSCLVAAAGGLMGVGLPHVLAESPNPKGIVEFSLLYFSLINGWFLYAHHCGARFREVSRLNWVFSWMFIAAMIYAVTHASMTNVYYSNDKAYNFINSETRRVQHHRGADDAALNNTSSSSSTSFEDDTTAVDPTTTSSMYNYRQFSLGMICMRVAVFCMLARVACYVDRAQPLAALLAVFIGDAILCFALSAASDVESASILWAFVAITELHVDFFLAVGLRGPLQVPFRLEITMDRFYAILLAPMGGIVVHAFLHSTTTATQEGLFAFASLVLLTLFGLLYFALKDRVIENLNLSGTSHVEKASAVILLKLLGYTMWVIGACLLVEPDLEHQSYTTNLMGWMVGAGLVCLFLLRSMTGQPVDRAAIVWVILSVVPWILIVLVRDSKPLVILSGLVVVVAFLNLIESWNALEETIVMSTGQQINVEEGYERRLQEEEDQQQHEGSGSEDESLTSHTDGSENLEQRPLLLSGTDISPSYSTV